MIRTLAAILVSGSLMWLLAGAFHELNAAFFVAEGGAPEGGHQSVGLIFLGYLLLAGLMALAFDRARISAAPWVKGGVVGVFVGLLWVFPHGVVLAAAHGDSLSYEVLNALWHVIEQGVGGVALAALWPRAARPLAA